METEEVCSTSIVTRTHAQNDKNTIRVREKVIEDQTQTIKQLKRVRLLLSVLDSSSTVTCIQEHCLSLLLDVHGGNSHSHAHCVSTIVFICL